MTNPQSTSSQFLTPDESADVDRALLSQSEKFLTRLTISSLRPFLFGMILVHLILLNWSPNEKNCTNSIPSKFIVILLH